MTCSKCNRAINPGDVDKNGRCCFCAPVAEKAHKPTEAEAIDIGRPKDDKDK